MKFIDSIGNYLSGWREAEVGGVRLLVMRDEVERTTIYKHRSLVVSANQRGVYPFIACGDGQSPRMTCKFKTGYIRGYAGFRNLIVNADGKVKTWEGQLLSFTTDDRGGACFVAEVPGDEGWVRHLEAISRSKAAVWRMSFEQRRGTLRTLKPAERDFEVEPWNKKLIAEVLTAYSALLPTAKGNSSQAAKPQSPPTQRPDPTPSPDSPVTWGPVRLMPDGSITGPDAGLRLPPGVAIGGMEVRGYTLRSDASGAYLLTTPQGATSAARFREGRWQMPNRTSRADQ